MLRSNLGVAYVCGSCQTPALQPLGRTIDKPNVKGESVRSFKSAQGTTKGDSCEHCGSTTHVSSLMSFLNVCG